MREYLLYRKKPRNRFTSISRHLRLPRRSAMCFGGKNRGIGLQSIYQHFWLPCATGEKPTTCFRGKTHHVLPGKNQPCASGDKTHYVLLGKNPPPLLLAMYTSAARPLPMTSLPVPVSAYKLILPQKSHSKLPHTMTPHIH